MSGSASGKNRAPLAGVRVLEFGQIAAGPFAGSLLADLGADVVKVENPAGGDGMRGWPPLSSKDGGPAFSENFAAVNRNKRSIAIDLKDDASVARLKTLCAVADVVLENFRAGVLGRLGLGYDELKALNRRVVYCSISGYGQTGPYAGKGAFDVTVQGMAGLMSITGEEGRPPVKCGVPVGDFCAGLYAAYTITAALMRARETGEGAHIDCSMLGSLLGVAALQTSEYFGTGRPGARIGSAHPRNAPYQAFRAQDDYFIIAAGNDALWCEVAEAVGLPELIADPRFDSQLNRARNQIALAGLLEVKFAERPAREWLAEMDRRGVPCAPINSYPDILSDPHVAQMGLVQPLRLPNGVETRTIGFPVVISGWDYEIYRAPPELGAHTQEVMAEWMPRPAERAGTAAEQARPTASRSAADPILIRQAGAVTELVLNRPDKANALDQGMAEALLAAVTQAASTDARLLVLRGFGRHFCAGFDFSDLDRQSEGDLLHRFVRIEQLLQTLHHAPLTTLALCHGSAFGAGADLVAACDRRIAAPATRFRMPGLRFGVVLGTRRLAALIGADAAHEILITSRTFEAAEAKRLGFVQRVAEPDSWPDLVSSIVDAQKLEPAAAVRLKARVKEDTRAADMAALVDSVTVPGLKDRIRAFRLAGS